MMAEPVVVDIIPFKVSVTFFPKASSARAIEIDY